MTIYDTVKSDLFTIGTQTIHEFSKQRELQRLFCGNYRQILHE